MSPHIVYSSRSAMAIKRRIVGTAGHIDHGKTALVRAITGVDGDRLPEEKRRGITIDLGFAHWTSDDYQISFIDVPGHERFVRNMLAGVGGVDSVVLVVAADESVMPQTREHFAICNLLRIPAGVVAITKSDLVDEEMLAIVRLEIDEMVRGSFLEGEPVIAVSSVSRSGITELQRAIIASVAALPDRRRDGMVLRLPIDRAFTMKGFGSVVTGTLVSGTLKTDREVEVLPEGLRCRARGIQVHGGQREEAIAGERTSVNVSDLALDVLHRGQQIVETGVLQSTQIVTAELEVLPGTKPVRNQARIRFHHFSSELLGSVRIIGSDQPEIGPGESAFVQIRLESPLVAIQGDRFIVRRYSPPATIGGGVVLDPHLPKLARATRPELLETLRDGTAGQKYSLLVRLAGLHGLSVSALRARTGLARAEIAATLKKHDQYGLVPMKAGEELRWIHEEHLKELRRKAMDFLTTFFRANRMALGVPKGEFVQKVLPGGLDGPATGFLMSDLAAQKIIVSSGDWIDVPGRSKDLVGAEGELARLIEQRFLDAALQPPPVSELIQTIAQKPKVIEGVLGYLVKTARLVRLADGLYLHPDAIASAAERISVHRGETINVAWFKDFYSLTRKVAIPLLEHFDRLGVTRRVGDERQVL